MTKLQRGIAHGLLAALMLGVVVWAIVGFFTE